MKIAAAHHGGGISESESSDYKISSSGDDSLLTDEGKLSLKPHNARATSNTIHIVKKCGEEEGSVTEPAHYRYVASESTDFFHRALRIR